MRKDSLNLVCDALASMRPVVMLAFDWSEQTKLESELSEVQEDLKKQVKKLSALEGVCVCVCVSIYVCMHVNPFYFQYFSKTDHSSLSRCYDSILSDCLSCA